MNRIRVPLLLLALIAALAALTQGVRVLARQRQERQALQERATQLDEQLAAQRRVRDGLQRDLGLAEHELADRVASSSTTEGGRDPERESEISAWLARIARLKQLLEQHPEQRIPEMQLLTDEDWLLVGRKISLETEEGARKALAEIRNAAKVRFQPRLNAAIRKYTGASNGQAPANAMTLAPYFDDPASSDALARYEIAGVSGRPNAATIANAAAIGLQVVLGSSQWTVREIAPIDADYDTRTQVTDDGITMALNAPTAWIPNFRERREQAAKAYAEANLGANPTSEAALLPYFNPPFDSATTERLRKAWQEQKQ
jgi:hypothetical protein